MQRRTFLQNTSGVLSLVPMLGYSKLNPFVSDTSVRLEVYATNWGFDGDMDSFCKKAKEERYDGIEVWTPIKKEAQEKLLDAIHKYKLKLGLLAGNSGTTFEEHYSNFQIGIAHAINLQPSFINCHSGKDYFNQTQGSHFITLTQEVEESSGIPIYHETHRGRLLYAAHVADQYFDHYPDLRVTLDISHWCNVHESLLDDQSEAVNRALTRTGHIHARVGFQEGPQIPDHKDPQYSNTVEKHLGWWDAVAKSKSDQGKTLTITTEFGPPGYMWTQPYSAEPLADNWEINVSMMQLLRERYSK